ncbi:hypothetical protein VTN96DRAFT_9521 [Rasamsonia emersonii]
MPAMRQPGCIHCRERHLRCKMDPWLQGTLPDDANGALQVIGPFQPAPTAAKQDRPWTVSSGGSGSGTAHIRPRLVPRTSKLVTGLKRR